MQPIAANWIIFYVLSVLSRLPIDNTERMRIYKCVVDSINALQLISNPFVVVTMNSICLNAIVIFLISIFNAAVQSDAGEVLKCFH